jgi:oxygen-independent coproporphyrinogen III oxidase
MAHLDITRTDFTFQYPPFNLLQVKDSNILQHKQPLHVYVHIPYCKTRCRYCYYKLWAVGEHRSDEIDEYLKLLSREIEIVSREPEVQACGVRSLYIGGGTPSLLSLHQLTQLFEQLKQSFPFTDGYEFCVEANPDEDVLTPEKLALMKDSGVTRLSMGVQTLDDRIQKLNGRAGSANEFYREYETARSLGFHAINLDFMSGMLGENWTNWTRQFDSVLTLRPENVSMYKLEFYLNTRLTKQISKTKRAPGLLSDEEEATYAQYAFERLQEGGYIAKNCYSLTRDEDVAHVHTAGVWDGESLLGLGLSAYGVFGDRMYQNTAELKDYQQAILSGKRPVLRAHLISAPEQIARTMVFGIKSLGIGRSKFRERHGFEMMLLYGDTIRDLIDRGLLIDDGETIRVPRSKYIYADDICRAFFLPEHETMMRGHLTRSKISSFVVERPSQAVAAAKSA